MTFLEKIQELHKASGNVSYGMIAIGTGISKGNAHGILTGSTKAGEWDTVKKLVEFLNGDPAEFYELWLKVYKERYKSPRLTITSDLTSSIKEVTAATRELNNTLKKLIDIYANSVGNKPFDKL